MYKIFLATACVFVAALASGQDRLMISERDTMRLSPEDSLLLVRAGQGLQAKWDSLEQAAGSDSAAVKIRNFCLALEEWYNHRLSFFYNLPQLTKVGQVYAADSLLKITSWNIPREDGSMKYYSYFQRIRPDSSGYYWIRLHDSTDVDIADENRRFTAENWYGALYYEAVPFTFMDTLRYLLLGIDLQNQMVTRKVLDIATFTTGKHGSKQVFFGCPCLLQPDGSLQVRDVFRYSAHVSMVMRYETSRHRVVMDHLSPPRKALEGEYRFYGPDFSYDAYIWMNNRWMLLRDVEVRNIQKPPL